MHTLSFDVGVFLSKQVRNFLKELRFKGHNIDWIENKSFLERRFVIRGEDQVLLMIWHTLESWGEEIDKNNT